MGFANALDVTIAAKPNRKCQAQRDAWSKKQQFCGERVDLDRRVIPMIAYPTLLEQDMDCGMDPLESLMSLLADRCGVEIDVLQLCQLSPVR
jgi:hypothetical protein